MIVTFDLEVLELFRSSIGETAAATDLALEEIDSWVQSLQGDRCHRCHNTLVAFKVIFKMSTNLAEKEPQEQQEESLLENPERQATNANVIVNPLESSHDTTAVDHTNGTTDDSPGTR